MPADPNAPILALETSCDETAAAVLRGPELCSSVISSQIEIHRETGGVVPEVASRNHIQNLRPVIDQALAEAGIGPNDLAAVAATAGPGLASSLLIGNSAAKGMALALGVPFVAVNHLEGHLLSPFLPTDPEPNEADLGSVPPHLGLVVSGGHTLLIDVAAVGDYELLGKTRDDAAGEAFDKVAKMLGLPYPGGPEIEKRAKGGDPNRFDLPRSMLHSGDFAFSFSGLKTAVLYVLPKLEEAERDQWLPDLCASFQAAVIEVLVKKTLAAAKHAGREVVAASGGVSCNRALRSALTEACESAGLQFRIAAPALTTDNAAMIGFAAWHRLRIAPDGDPLEADVDPNLPLAVAES